MRIINIYFEDCNSILFLKDGSLFSIILKSQTHALENPHTLDNPVMELPAEYQYKTLSHFLKIYV